MAKAKRKAAPKATPKGKGGKQLVRKPAKGNPTAKGKAKKVAVPKQGKPPVRGKAKSAAKAHKPRPPLSGAPRRSKALFTADADRVREEVHEAMPLAVRQAMSRPERTHMDVLNTTHEVEVQATFIARFTDDGKMDLNTQAMIAADVAVDVPDADKASVELISNVWPTGHFERGGPRRTDTPEAKAFREKLVAGTIEADKIQAPAPETLMAGVIKSDYIISGGGGETASESLRRLSFESETIPVRAADQGPIDPKDVRGIAITKGDYDHAPTDPTTGGKLTEHMLRQGDIAREHVRMVAEFSVALYGADAEAKGLEKTMIANAIATNVIRNGLLGSAQAGHANNIVTRVLEADEHGAPKNMNTFSVTQPSVALLVKLGSIIVHFDEASSQGGHKFDIEAAVALLNDPEVKTWMEGMQNMALLPVKRDMRG